MKKNKKYLLVTILMAVLSLMPDCKSRASLRAMANDEMARVSGTGGFSIAIKNFSFYMFGGSWSYTDTDTGNSLILDNVTLSNGNNRPVIFSTGAEDVNGDGEILPLTFDILTILDPSSPIYNEPLMMISAPDWSQQLNISVDSLSFCGQDLGSLNLGVIHNPNFYVLLGAHDSGVDFEFGQNLTIDSLRYAYNNGDSNANLTLSGIHFFGTDETGSPEDPGTWQMHGNFTIGAMVQGNPATFDVGTVQVDAGLAGVSMNLPLNGSFRVESLQWGGTDFGPVAIDGIDVHRLNVRFIP